MKGMILGSFELLELLGKGGMGQVWRARHTQQDHDVAIKFLTSDKARQQSFQLSFEREVLSMARLHHQHIALVVDYGLLADDLGELQAGAPFLVMEYIEGQSLKEARAQLTWEQLSRQIHDLLDALGHAHAKGIIHRDLKPQNVIVSHAGESKLVDFGIALDYETTMNDPVHQQLDQNADNRITGTPRYMSPEQIEGRWREQGPWTDLYSLGCLFWESATGAPLFSGSLMLVLSSQIAQPPPPMKSRFAVPAGFEQWLNILLRKDPRERFQRAADALAAFEQIAARFEPDHTVRHTHEFMLGEEADPDEATMLVDLDEGLTNTMERIRKTRAITDLKRKRADAPPAAPLLSDWRDGRDTPHRLDLLGSGLGLWGVRSLPMIGRERERDLLWQSLLLASRKRSPHLVVLRGEPGCGKSRIATWLCRRAHESGAAHVLRATYSPHASALDGFGPMLIRFFEAYGQERAARATQIVKRLGSARGIDLAALVEITEVMADEGASPGDDYNKKFHNLRERHYALIDLIVRLCEERPTILWVDDAQWGLDGMLFLKDLFKREELYDLPLLVLATERIDGSHTDARPMITELLKQPRARVFELGQLLDVEHEALVEQMLGLEPGLAEQVVKRTQGNPLFAVQLVGDWVARGLLTVSSQGFALRPGALAELPADLHALWHSRLKHTFGKFAAYNEQGLMQSLELAAALGQEISQLEWEKLCERAGFEVPSSFVQALLSNHLITQEVGVHDSWSFAHSMLHEHLVQHARDHVRWKAYHAQIAGWLSTQSHRIHGHEERMARHLMMADMWKDALRPLLDSTQRHTISGDYDTCAILIDAYELCLSKLGTPLDHPDHIKLLCQRALTARNIGARAEAEDYIERATNQLGEGPEWLEARAFCIKVTARLHEDQGRMMVASDMIAECAEMYRQLGDEREYARALTGQAQSLIFANQRDQTLGLLTLAISRLRALDDVTGLLIAHYILSIYYTVSEEVEAAHKTLEYVVNLARKEGNRMQEGNAENALGNLELRQEHWPVARVRFERAAELFRPCGDVFRLVAELNMSYLDIFEQRDPAESLERIREIAARLRTLQLGRFYPTMYTIQLYFEGLNENWREWEEVSAEVMASFKPEQHDRTAYKTLTMAGEHLIKIGHLERARKLLTMALSGWRISGEEAQITRVQDLIDRCRLFL